MPQIIDFKRLPDEQKKAAISKGINPDDTLFVFDDVKGEGRLVKKSEQGGLGGLLATASGEFGEGLLPNVAAVAGAAGLTALAAPTTGPGALAVGVGGGLSAGIGTAVAQQKVIEEFFPEYALNQEIRRRSNPMTALIGSVASGSPMGRGFLALGKALTKGELGTAAKLAAAPAVIGGGLEAYNEYNKEGEFDPVRIGLAALGNVVTVDNTKLGNLAESFGRKLVGKAPVSAAPAVDVNTTSPYETSNKVMSAFRGGQLVEGSELHKQLLRESNLDDSVSVDQLVTLASRLEQSTIKNNPDLRSELAGKLYDALAQGQDPAVLAESKIETLIKDLYKAGDIKSRADAVRIAKAPNADDELNALRRERAENAGPPPLQPGTRLTDEQVDILLKTPPETKIPNASKLDEAVIQGRKDGWLNSPDDIRRLEDTYLVNPDNLPAASRALLEEKQARAAGPTAADVADAFEKRDIEFLTTILPKEMKALTDAGKQLAKLEKQLGDKNIPGDVLATLQSRAQSGRASLSSQWQKLGEKTLKRYATAAEKYQAELPTKYTNPQADLSVLGRDLEAEAMLRRSTADMRRLGIEPGTGPQGIEVTKPAVGLLGVEPPTLGQQVSAAGKPADNPASAQGLDSPTTRFSGVSPRLVRDFGQMLLKAADPLVRLPHEGRLTKTGQKLFSGTQSTMDRIRELGPAGEAIRVADDKMNRDAVKVINTATRLYSEAYAALDAKSTSKVNRYLNDMQIAGESFVTLSPSEQTAVNKIRRGLLYLANQGILRGGPGVSEGALFREMKIDPNYIPTIPDSKVRKLVKEGGPEAAKYIQDWNAWYQNKLNKSQAEAEQMMNEYLANTGSPNPLNAAQYNAITQAEGVGLPPSWRADTKKTLMYHAFRAAKNYAWFTHVQKNPAVAKAIGVTDDGWGGKIDLDAIPGDSIQNNPAVQSWVAEQNLHMNQDEDMLEKLTRLATGLQLGPLTGLRDLTATPAHLAELLPVGEAGTVIKALKNIMTSDVRGGMEKQGLVRNKNLQPFEFLRAGNSDTVFDRVVEATRAVQGRNKIESGARQWAYEIGRLAAAGRLSKGDMAFFERLDLPDYKNLTPDQLIEATGAKFVETAQGNYRSTGLPPWLLSGKENKNILAFLSLQRWGVERFNNWYKNAWRPAVDKGEFEPLLKSIFAGLAAGSAVATMQQLLFNQKPREMTWAEFMRSEDKEAAYTLFSKLQNAGFAGVYGNMLAAGVKTMHGEWPNEVRNLGVDLVAKGLLRIGQAGEALANRGASGFDVLGDFLDAYAKDTIQGYRLIANHGRPDLGAREERMMERQQGKIGVTASLAKALSNPFDPMKELRAAQSEGEIQKALPQVRSALTANQNYDPRLQTSLRSPEYYDFVGGLQGPSAQQAAESRDQDQENLTLLKKQELQRLKWETQIIGGPQ